MTEDSWKNMSQWQKLDQRLSFSLKKKAFGNSQKTENFLKSVKMGIFLTPDSQISIKCYNMSGAELGHGDLNFLHVALPTNIKNNWCLHLVFVVKFFFFMRQKTALLTGDLSTHMAAGASFYSNKHVKIQVSPPCGWY